MSAPSAGAVPPELSVTRLLDRVRDGAPEAFDDLLVIVYDELRVMARHRLRHERRGHTLNTTALVHEAYLKLVGERERRWENRSHFLAVASLAMRRILINYAHARRAAKRGSGAVHVDLDSIPDLVDDDRVDELVALDEALTRLAEFNPRGARVVQYRFFGGLTHEETADALGVSTVTARRAWGASKAWLRIELGEDVLPASDCNPNEAETP